MSMTGCEPSFRLSKVIIAGEKSRGRQAKAEASIGHVSAQAWKGSPFGIFRLRQNRAKKSKLPTACTLSPKLFIFRVHWDASPAGRLLAQAVRCLHMSVGSQKGHDLLKIEQIGFFTRAGIGENRKAKNSRGRISTPEGLDFVWVAKLILLRAY
ncbi:hypothetical protein LH704_21150 [Burkholderia cenocepacia]|uniref:hypothetical protein n=1 Tax=Burkholderia cenocepacia TaxID=95486 RepID=UPI001F2F32FC|nr:hypothetical protein [Burkholderia cenocepacia]MCF1369256.1 hypothetical protein [Burkholderia cenocepacia]MCF1386713.1 hypothetical protein [Burkholderia cenocepacia]